MKRLSLGRGAVVILAAAVLAGAGSMAGYGVSGGSSHHTTVIENSGRGAALALRNRPAYPPLTVTSSKKVVHLNADLVDGKHAGQLEPNTFVWSIGKAGQELTQIAGFAVPSGWYEASAHATAESTDGKTYPARCFIYPQLQVETGDYDNLIETETVPTDRAYLSVAGDIFIDPNDHVLAQCSNDGGAESMKLMTPITLTLRPIKVTPGPGSKVLERR